MTPAVRSHPLPCNASRSFAFSDFDFRLLALQWLALAIVCGAWSGCGASPGGSGNATAAATSTPFETAPPLRLKAETAAWSRRFAVDSFGGWTGAVDAGPFGPKTLFVRTARGLAALDDATGATKWSAGAFRFAVDGDRAAIANPTGVALLRASDGHVRWRLPIARATDVAFTAGEVAVLVDCDVTIVDAGAPSRRRSKKMPEQRCVALQTIGRGYVFSIDAFDGAWMGLGYSAIDLTTGATRWRTTDANLVASTRETVRLEYEGSMMPLGPPGWTADVRLADGATLSSSPPPNLDLHGGDPVVRADDAAFAAVLGTVRRFGPNDDTPTTTPAGEPDGGRVVFPNRGCDDVALRALETSLFVICSMTGATSGAQPYADLFVVTHAAGSAPAAKAVASFATAPANGRARGFATAVLRDANGTETGLAILGGGHVRVFDPQGTERRDLRVPCDDALGDTAAVAPTPFAIFESDRSLVVACVRERNDRIFAFA